MLVGRDDPALDRDDETGAAARLADGLVDIVGDAGPYALLLGLFVLTAVLGQLISNMATALIVIPVAISAAAEIDVSARPVLMCVTVVGGGRVPDAGRDAGEPDGDGPGRLPLRRLLEARPAAARRSTASSPSCSCRSSGGSERERRPAPSERRSGVSARRRSGLRLRFFAAPRGQPRARRGTDVVAARAGAASGSALAIAAYPPSALERSLEAFLAALPGWLDPVWGFLADLLWLWALVLVVVALVRRRFVVVGQALAALVLAALLRSRRAASRRGRGRSRQTRSSDCSARARFPAPRAAEATAVIVTVSPHLARPVRAFGRCAARPRRARGGRRPAAARARSRPRRSRSRPRRRSGSSRGRRSAGRAWTTSPPGWPSSASTRGALEEAERQVAGVFHVRGVDEEGRPLLVKVYGRDAYDTSSSRGSGAASGTAAPALPIRLGRLEAAEHEALRDTARARGRSPGREVVTAARRSRTTTRCSSCAATQGRWRRSSRESSTMISCEAHGTALARLADLGVAHQQLDPETVAVASTARSASWTSVRRRSSPTGAQLVADRARLLMTTAASRGASGNSRSDRRTRAATASATCSPTSSRPR